MLFRTPLRGFTLIELLVVIAIIGILSSVVLASLNSARLKSRDARRVADMKQIHLALTLYFEKYGQYPANALAQGTSPLITDGFIPTIPQDPLAPARVYTYAATGTGVTCRSFHLGAMLEDPANHPAMKTDIDAPSGGALCTGGGTEFDGTSAVPASGTISCNATAGVAQGLANATEACFDMKP